MTLSVSLYVTVVLLMSLIHWTDINHSIAIVIVDKMAMPFGIANGMHYTTH